MSQSQIQSTLNSIANQQVSNEFGTQRSALLFAPGTYGTSTNPLNFQVGYYTSVAGLCGTPGGVLINTALHVFNPRARTPFVAPTKFFRPLSNPTHQLYTPRPGRSIGPMCAG